MASSTARSGGRIVHALPPPREVTAQSLVRGLARAQQLIGPAGLLLSIGLLVEVGLRRGDAAPVLPAIVSLAALLAVALVHAARPSIATAVGMLAAGLPIVTVCTAAVVGSLSVAESHGAFLVEAAAMALIFIGAVRPRARDGIGWTLAGFATGSTGLALGQKLAGVPIALSWDRTTDAIIIAAAYIVVAIGWGRSRGTALTVPAIERATRAAHRGRLREHAAAAVAHDTVLASLTLIARAETDQLDERLRRSIPRDIETLMMTVATARGTRGAIAAPGNLLAPRLRELAERLRWQGLRVDVTGADILPIQLEPEVVDAVVGAVAAALENVHEHAGVDRADVTIGMAGDGLTVLVVDAGGGFDVDAEPGDRLGLRQAIRGRIERVGGTVRLWSGETGTTVVMTVPVDLLAMRDGAS